uniref:FXYD domain-containing ion transport regulator n=1 Tax=Serinus canaria TaxID=9135 RepID=A0A8C9L3U4_SERCA
CSQVSPGLPVLSQGLSPSCPQVCPRCPQCPRVSPDWCHLRVGGLVVAAVLSVLGIAVLLSGKCKCRSKARWD